MRAFLASFFILYRLEHQLYVIYICLSTYTYNARLVSCRIFSMWFLVDEESSKFLTLLCFNFSTSPVDAQAKTLKINNILKGTLIFKSIFTIRITIIGKMSSISGSYHPTTEINVILIQARIIKRLRASISTIASQWFAEGGSCIEVDQKHTHIPKTQKYV